MSLVNFIATRLLERQYTDAQILEQMVQEFGPEIVSKKGRIASHRADMNSGRILQKMMDGQAPIARLVEFEGKIVPYADRPKTERKPRAPKYTQETDPLNTVAGIKVATKKPADPKPATPAPVATKKPVVKSTATKKAAPAAATKKVGLPATKIAKGKVAKKNSK